MSIPPTGEGCIVAAKQMKVSVESVRRAEDVLQLERVVNDGIDVKIAADLIGQNDYAVYDGEQLIGYLALFPYLPTEYEVNAIVHPEYRQQGVFRQLLEAAATEAKAQGCEAFTFVIDRRSASGKAVMNRIGADYQFSEYNLVLKKAELFLKPDPVVSIREAKADERSFIIKTLADAFGNTVEDATKIYETIDTPERITFIGEANGKPVGVIRALLVGEDGGSIHAFAVRREAQGQGHGTKMLKQFVQQLFRMGRTKLELDVETENKAALEIYKRAGFAEAGGYEFYLQSIEDILGGDRSQ